MMYKTPIYFQRVTQGAYNSLTGDYGADTVAEVLRYADVTDTGDKTSQFVYGEQRTGSLTVRLQRPYNSPFDFIRIGSKKYRADKIRGGILGKSYIVSEVL